MNPRQTPSSPHTLPSPLTSVPSHATTPRHPFCTLLPGLHRHRCPMTPLRQHVIDDVRLIGRSKQTQRSHLCFISRFARYYRRCPSELGTALVRQFFLHLRRIGRKPETLKGYHAALRFLYNIVLERPDVIAGVPKPKVPRRDHFGRTGGDFDRFATTGCTRRAWARHGGWPPGAR
ncbi:MAG: hypothetical protein ACI9MC_000556 [Kiritimatiellia bacterium]|jgi:hypothetical protein